eukprot:Partr_v1_DN26785_c0_g1_i3_m8910 putative LIMR family
MADIALIVTSSIFAVLVLIASVYFLVYFQHPDDKWVAWGPKIVVILGVTLCCLNVLVLPLDVANQGGQLDAIGGLPMEGITLGLFVASIILAAAAVPFMMFYYEGLDDSEDKGSDPIAQIIYAVKWSSISLIVFFTGCSLLWYYYGYAEFRIVELESRLHDHGPAPLTYTNYCVTTACLRTTGLVEKVEVSYIMYMVALASFVGWVLFAIFGGVGLAAFPFDLVLGYKNRPKKIGLTEYSEKKKSIGDQASLLLQDAAAIAQKKKESNKKQSFASQKARALKKSENGFKRDVLNLESQWKRLEDSYKHGGGNPLVQWFLLAVGLIGSLISFFWFVHILIYVLPLAAEQKPISPFLNSFFENTFPVPIIGIVFYGMFTFWLLLCVMKGTIKLGVRFLIITVHPIVMGESMMSSLLFNVGIMLFCSMAVTQFCSVAFGEYARFTASATIFGSQLQNIRGIKWVYSILQYVLPVMTFLTSMYVSIHPFSKKKKNRKTAASSV